MVWRGRPRPRPLILCGRGRESDPPALRRSPHPVLTVDPPPCLPVGIQSQKPRARAPAPHAYASRGKTQHAENPLRGQRTDHRGPGSLPGRSGGRHYRFVAAVPVPSRGAYAKFCGQHSHHLPHHAAEGEGHSPALHRHPAGGGVFPASRRCAARAVFGSPWPPGCCSFLLPRKVC